MPQMNVSPPEGVHSADWAVPVGCDPPMVIKASNAIRQGASCMFLGRESYIGSHGSQGSGLRAEGSGVASGL